MRIQNSHEPRMLQKIGLLTMELEAAQSDRAQLLGILQQLQAGTIMPEQVAISENHISIRPLKAEEESASDDAEVLDKNGASGQEPPSNEELRGIDALAEAQPVELREE